jgi:hypothetical protein
MVCNSTQYPDVACVEIDIIASRPCARAKIIEKERPVATFQRSLAPRHFRNFPVSRSVSAYELP